MDGIDGDDWLLIQDLYSDCTSRVKWAGLLSDSINLKQGVRQGGVLSTSHYKRYNNPLLLQLEERYTDVKIGSINIPHITVADDLAVLARSYGSQQIKIWEVDNNTCRERYYVNPVKSSTLFYHFSRGSVSECTDIFMAGDKISNDSNTTHLGTYRDIIDKPTCNIEESSILPYGRWIPQRKRVEGVSKRFHMDNFCFTEVNLWTTSLNGSETTAIIRHAKLY